MMDDLIEDTLGPKVLCMLLAVGEGTSLGAFVWRNVWAARGAWRSLMLGMLGELG